MPSRPAYDVVAGQDVATRSPSGPTDRAATTTPRQSTNTAKPGCAACTARRTSSSPARTPQTTRTTAVAPGDPERVDPERRQHREADQHQQHGDDGGPGVAGRLVGQGPGRADPEVGAVQRRGATTYSTTSTTASTGAIRAAKPPKVRSRCGIASRFVRLETGQQQRGGVGHPQAGLGARPVRQAERDGGGHDDRRDQDDRGVETEHGGDGGGEHEDAGQQPHRVAAAERDHAMSRRGEDARTGADLGHDQDRAQERDDRAEVAELVPRAAPGTAGRWRG